MREDVLKKKKILIISPLLIKGGSERTVSMLSHAFTDQGYDVVVVTYRGPVEYPIAGKTIILNIPSAQSLFKKILRAIARIRALRRVMHEECPDITVSFLSNIASILTLRPLIVSIRSHYERMACADKIALRTIYRLPNVKAIVVPSAGLQQSLERHAGMRRVVVIPNAVDEKEIARHAVADGDRAEGTTIVAIGRLVAVKRFDLLIRAFASSSVSENVTLLILGDGIERAALEAIARKYPSARIRFVGQVDDPVVYLSYISRARCLVLTSEMETFASVIIEALACGTPVIATDCDFGPREILRDNEGGILVPNGDQHALTRALERIVTDDALYERLRHQTKSRAHDFSVEKITEKWNTLFASYEKML